MDEKLYQECLANGCSEALALMLASHSFPGTKGTERAFMQGRSLGGGQFDHIPLVGDHHRQMADRAGVSTTGKFYQGTLARYPGDPEAWVSDLHDVKARCEERGWGAEGAITVQPHERGSVAPGGYQVASDLLEDYLQDRIENDPGLEGKRDEVRAELASQLSGLQR